MNNGKHVWHNTIAFKVVSSLVLVVSTAMTSVVALEVNGIVLQKTANLSDGTVVTLKGAGVRQKFFIDVYVGALYVSATHTSAETILDGGQANRVEMHILYDEIADTKLVKAWNDGFNANQSTEVIEQLREKIDAFNMLFPSVRKGDVIRVDYLPGSGTKISVNGAVLGIVPGSTFNRAVLSIWLGQRPVSKSLKHSMLFGN